MDSATGDQEPPSGGYLKDATLGPKGLVKTSEFIRLIIDALTCLGFNTIATDLENQSRIPLHTPATKQFLELVKNQEWDKSIDALKRLRLSNEKPVRLLLLQQKYIKFLENEQVLEALKTIREEIQPLGLETRLLHKLASKILKPDSVDEEGTEVVKKKLQVLLPTGVMVPHRRLEYLLDEDLDSQKMNCDFHNVPDSDLSLFSFHYCDKQKIPSVTLQVLSEHTDEVWFLTFSHDGKCLASSSKDKTAILWEMDADGKFRQKHKLVGHEKPVVAVLWSPDDQQVITCGENEVIKRWDAVSGQCVGSYARVDVGFVSCGWLHDGSGIIGAMSDRRICLWSLDGTEMDYEQEQRAQTLSDVAMTNDGKWIVSVGKERNEISLISRETRAERLIQLHEKEIITSFSLSRDNNYLLIDLITQEIQLWDIEGDDEPSYLTKYDGHKRSLFVIRSCFGGYDEDFIASGSEDSQVYIWHVVKGLKPCRVLRGHSGAVNCVSWNPTDIHMLASGSDDRTIRIWGLAKN